MKARDWVAKFLENPESAQQQFVEETAELVELRTKKSKDKFRGPALEGAVREQRQKWHAICMRLPQLDKNLFDSVLVKHASDIAREYNNFLRKGGKQERDNNEPLENPAPTPSEPVPVEPFVPGSPQPSGCSEVSFSFDERRVEIPVAPVPLPANKKKREYTSGRELAEKLLGNLL